MRGRSQHLRVAGRWLTITLIAGAILGFAQLGRSLHLANFPVPAVELLIIPLGPSLLQMGIESNIFLDQGGVFGIKDTVAPGFTPDSSVFGACDGVDVVCTVVPGASIGIPDSTYIVIEVFTPGALGDNVGGPVAVLGFLSSTSPELDSTGVGTLTGGSSVMFPGVSNEHVFFGYLEDMVLPVPALDGRGLALLAGLLAAFGAFTLRSCNITLGA